MTTPRLDQWLSGPFRRALDRVSHRRSPALPAPQVLVTAPGTEFSYGAVDQPFHSASVGKVFTAVLIGRLVEQGMLRLDSPVGELAPALDLTALPSVPGVELARELTVADLLSHRSGLPDPILPGWRRRTECDLRALQQEPDRLWSPGEILAQCRGLPPTGRPGARFAYGDASYALLLLVAEAVAGRPFTQLLAEEVFAPAGMTRTGHPHLDPAVSLAELDLAPMLLAGADVSRARSLSAGSADGGGVTTLADLRALTEALCTGRLLGRATVQRLATVRSRLRPGIHYGAGLCTLRFGELVPFGLNDLPQPVGGLGLSGVHAFAYPKQGAHVILNLHSDRAMSQSFRLHIALARQLARLTPQEPTS